METSVVIVTRGDSPLLGRCVAAIAGGRRKPREIVLIDQSGRPPDPELEASLTGEGIACTHVPIDRAGVATARNRGALEASGELIAFTDDDCVPDGGWLANGVAALEREGAEAATGRVLPLDEGIPGRVAVSLRTDPRYRVFADGGAAVPWEIGTGGNLIVKRSAFEGLGGFDPAFGPGGRFRAAEDVELLERLVDAGSTVVYDPDSVVRHEMKDRSDRMARSIPYGYGMGALIAGLASGRRRRVAGGYLSMQLRLLAASVRRLRPAAAAEVVVTLAGAALGAGAARRVRGSERRARDQVWRGSPIRFRQAGGRGSRVLRHLDQTIAIALLRTLGTLRRRRKLPAQPRRIGIMKAAGIGDMVMTTAVVRDIVARFSDAKVVIFAGAENAGIARLVAGAEVVELPTVRPWRTVPLIRAEHLDVLLDFGLWTRVEALYAALSGAGWTAGFATDGQRRHYAFDATVPQSPSVSELDHYRALAATLGVDSGSLPRFEPEEPLPELPVAGPYVVFHLWPGGYRSDLREWPQERWRELVRIADERGFAVILSGGPGDVERAAAFVESCGGPSERLASIAGEFGLATLTAILAEARCVVSVNTGVMHIAAAVGTATIALNGPTSSQRWGPIGPRTVTVDSELPGCGFLNLGWEYDGRRTDCMRGITVQRVAAALLDCIDD